MIDIKKIGEDLWVLEKKLNRLSIENDKRNKQLKIETEKLRKLNNLLEIKRKETNIISDTIEKFKSNNFQNELSIVSIENKNKNFKLAKMGKGHCLCCGYEWRLKSEGYNFTPCPNCKSRSWIVGDNYPCEICKRIQLTPEIHHINKDRKQNDPENLLFICKDCHTAIHFGIGKNKKSGLSKRRMYYSDEIVKLEIKKYRNLLPLKKIDEEKSIKW